MSEFLRNTLEETKRRFTDRDYVRWRMKRKLVRMALVILTLILMAPAIVILKAVNAPPVVAFGVTLVGVVFLLGMYSVVGIVMKSYSPPVDSSPSPQPMPAPFPSQLEAKWTPAGSVEQPPMATGGFQAYPAKSTYPDKPVPARSSGGVLLALFGGCAVMMLLMCSGVAAFLWLATPVHRQAMPEQRFEARPFDGENMAEKIRMDAEQMRKEHERRFEEIRQRQEELLNRQRR